MPCIKSVQLTNPIINHCPSVVDMCENNSQQVDYYASVACCSTGTVCMTDGVAVVYSSLILVASS